MLRLLTHTHTQIYPIQYESLGSCLPNIFLGPFGPIFQRSGLNDVSLLRILAVRFRMRAPLIRCYGPKYLVIYSPTWLSLMDTVWTPFDFWANAIVVAASPAQDTAPLV